MYHTVSINLDAGALRSNSCVIDDDLHQRRDMCGVCLGYRTNSRQEWRREVRHGHDGSAATRGHQTPEDPRGHGPPVHRQVLPPARLLLLLHRVHVVSACGRCFYCTEFMWSVRRALCVLMAVCVRTCISRVHFCMQNVRMYPRTWMCLST